MLLLKNPKKNLCVGKSMLLLKNPKKNLCGFVLDSSREPSRNL
jgi:hypothetical protein